MAANDPPSVLLDCSGAPGGSMMIADFDHHELDVVRMELSGDALAKWMKDPQRKARH
jgi:hypothetical protein